MRLGIAGPPTSISGIVKANGARRDDHKPSLVPVLRQHSEGRERDQRRAIGKADVGIEDMREDA